MEIKKPYVFISYSRKDYVDKKKNVIPDNTILKIVEALDKAGINRWIDLDGIYSGDEFAPIIGKAIKNCDLFLFVSSKNSNASQWASAEIASARNYRKKIIPVKIDESPYDNSVVIYVANLDAIEYYSNQEKGIERMVSGISSHFAKIEEEAKRAKEEEIRRIETEKQKAEEERRWKEQEERTRKEAQRQIIVEIKTECQRLNNEESKIELDRNTLLTSTEKITDARERENVKSLIASSSPLRKKVEGEMDTLRKQLEELGKEVKNLVAEKEDLVQTNAELGKTNIDLAKKLNNAEATAKEATRNHPSKLLAEKDSSIQYWKEQSEKWKKESAKYQSWWELRWNAWKKTRNWKRFWFILLLVLIGTGVFFWWQGNVKFVPKEKVTKAVSSINKKQQIIDKPTTSEEYNTMAINYYYGRNGVEKDYAKAIEYFKKAAEMGNSSSQNMLGYIYENGFGEVTKNRDEAIKWYKMAAKLGNEGAKNKLKELGVSEE